MCPSLWYKNDQRLFNSKNCNSMMVLSAAVIACILKASVIVDILFVHYVEGNVSTTGDPSKSGLIVIDIHGLEPIETFFTCIFLGLFKAQTAFF
ncbi:hypothetical protein FB192DRAFT_1402384 [Mucor lusitanicus]|uniref:Uncharacterized protein n=1 Tax=Mucor circinelloides f. lusitanicus TaxID=29924 RepID=A0A8H4B837_MUCCL|nr:hypothetical protein FB192DRAFT_1402384 [Mucor lusitanicus]